MPCSRHSSGTGVPASACLRIAMIWLSVNRDCFIANFLVVEILLQLTAVLRGHYQTTASVFGRELHSYVITDAIRDEKVLKFKVDYNDVRPQFKAIETEQDQKKLSAAENKQALLHADRIREITQYILNNYR